MPWLCAHCFLKAGSSLEEPILLPSSLSGPYNASWYSCVPPRSWQLGVEGGIQDFVLSAIVGTSVLWYPPKTISVVLLWEGKEEYGWRESWLAFQEHLPMQAVCTGNAVCTAGTHPPVGELPGCLWGLQCCGAPSQCAAGSSLLPTWALMMGQSSAAVFDGWLLMFLEFSKMFKPLRNNKTCKRCVYFFTSSSLAVRA